VHSALAAGSSSGIPRTLRANPTRSRRPRRQG
jgi:hypothetical protein